MTWTELTKNTVRHIITRGKVTTYRGNFGDYNTRGEIAKAVRGDASAEVTRKEMEDHFGTRNANSFTELTKNNSEWSNTW